MLKNESPLKQIDNLKVSIHPHPADLAINTHWHDYLEFELVLEGKYEHICNGKPYIAGPGDAWLMSYLDNHSVRTLTNSLLINIGFKGENLRKEIMDYLSLSSGGRLCHFDADTLKHIKKLCEDLKNELEQKPPFYNSAAASLLEQILITTIRSQNSTETGINPSNSTLLYSITSYLNKNFKNDITLNTLSEMFNLSPGHLGRLFKTKLKMSFNTYLNKLRVKHACNLLCYTDMSTKQISAECGYSSVEYFFYVFKNQLGCTPNEYRKENFINTGLPE